MNISSKIMAIMCATLMVVLAFQNVNAGGDNNGKDVDVFIDYKGNQHKVWREEVNGTFQVFYANNIGDNNTGIGHNRSLVSSSPLDVMYPQVAIDPVCNIGYILWVIEGEESEELWYCGSQDFVNWTDARYGGIIPSTTGNPTLDMSANNYTLYVTWKHGGALTIIPDLDGDFIPDIDDDNPFVYNVVGDESFIADAVAVNHELGISVAVDYIGTSTVEPIITLAQSATLNASIGPYVNITTESNQSFTAIIKFKYDNTTLSENITEEHLRMYWLGGEKWLILKNISAGEDTKIDLNYQFVWARTNHFSTFTVADSSGVDSDADELTDSQEILGKNNIGPYYRWEETFNSRTVDDLQKDEWSIITTGNSVVEIVDDALHIQSFTGSTNNDELAYVETPEIYLPDDTKDYKVGLKVKIPQTGHQWFQVLNFGQIYLLLFSGGDDARLKYSTSTGELMISDISLDTWHEIDCYVHPETSNYDVFIDRTYVKTCDFKGQNVRDKILLGDTWYPQNYGQVYWDYLTVWQGTDPLNGDSDGDRLNDDKEADGTGTVGPYYRWQETFDSCTVADLQNEGWTVSSSGVGLVEVIDGALHINSITGGTNNDQLAYVETPEISVDGTKDYVVGFKVEIPQAGHQWFQVLNFGQIYLLLFSGGDDARLKYSTPAGEISIRDMSLDTWYEIECYAHPESENYDLFIDGEYVKTCDFKGQNIRNNILIGDTWYPQNYGQAYWDYIKVWQGADPLNMDSEGDKLTDGDEILGENSFGPYYRWQETFDSCTVADLQNEGWTVGTSGNGIVEVVDGTLHIQSITGSTNNDELAYVESPEIYLPDDTKDYKIAFKVNIPQAGHQWFQVLNFGQVYLLLFSGGDDARLKYSTPTGELTIRDLSLNTWYEIDCYVHPGSENYDVFIDGIYSKTCDFKGSNVRSNILLGDTWYPQNYGQAYWDYIKVWQGTGPLNLDSDGDMVIDSKETLGDANNGAYLRWEETFDSCTVVDLQNEGWSLSSSGAGLVEVIDSSLHINSITGSTNNDQLAYAESPQIVVDGTKNYLVGFRVKVPQAGHQWFQVLNFGQVYLLLFSGGDDARLKCSTPTGEETISDLSLDTWYKIDCYAEPGSSTYDVFIDEIYTKTCDFKVQNVRSNILLGDTWFPQNYGQAYWDYIKVWQGIDALNPDSDGDYLNDNEEFTHMTKTLYPDSDGDGLWDYEELTYWDGVYAITGDAKHLWNGDVDNDGVINILDPYSDEDGWLDGDEVNIYYTKPYDRNTDSAEGDTIDDDLDIDPLVNLQVTVRITEIMQLDDVDSDGDFFVRVHINGVDLFGESFSGDNTPSWTNANDGSDWDNDNHKTSEEIGDRFTYTLDVPDDIEDVSVWIDLFDDDSGWLGGTDEWCDISGQATSDGDAYSPSNTDPDGRRAELTYNLKTGQWSGDDEIGDANGYGNVSGEDDGNTGDDDDCYVLFDIEHNDFDGDGLTYWEEVNNLNGVDLASMGANPLIPDIFVEVDWMATADAEVYNPTTLGVGFNDVIQRFSDNNINLHIDWGQGGLFNGGGQVPHDPNLYAYRNGNYNLDNDFWDIKNANFANNRQTIFHYCIFGDQYTTTANGAASQSSGISDGIPGDDFFVAIGAWYAAGQNLAWIQRNIVQITSTFMHEFGHNLGLRHNGDLDTPNNSPDYESIMSYFYQLDDTQWPQAWNGIPNYSDGNDVKGFDDWNDGVYQFMGDIAFANDPN